MPLKSLKAGLAMLHAEAGQATEARALIAGLGGATLSGVPHDYVRLPGFIFLAMACSALGDDPELAGRLCHELLPYRSQVLVAQ